MAHSQLGVYTYLARHALAEVPPDRYTNAVDRLAQYDARRRAELVRTLELYLREGRRISTTARGLYIHPNTLRQRLDRIQKVSGLDLATDDLLAVELAIKLVRLRSSMDDADDSA
jgi:PucR family transcriptional regulator, purine catabolism regulatory protein